VCARAFSVSKDRSVKYWDMDRWEMLLELPGHHGEVWALAISQYGDFLVTGGYGSPLILPPFLPTHPPARPTHPPTHPTAPPGGGGLRTVAHSRPSDCPVRHRSHDQPAP